MIKKLTISKYIYFLLTCLISTNLFAYADSNTLSKVVDHYNAHRSVNDLYIKITKNITDAEKIELKDLLVKSDLWARYLPEAKLVDGKIKAQMGVQKISISEVDIEKLSFIVNDNKISVDYKISAYQNIKIWSELLGAKNNKQSLYSLFVPSANAFVLPVLGALSVATVVYSLADSIDTRIYKKDFAKTVEIINTNLKSCKSEKVPSKRSDVLYKLTPNEDWYLKFAKEYPYGDCDVVNSNVAWSFYSYYYEDKIDLCEKTDLLRDCLQQFPSESKVRVQTKANLEKMRIDFPYLQMLTDKPKPPESLSGTTGSGVH